MLGIFVTFVLLSGLSIWALGQASSPPTEMASENDAVQITHGPVVENVTDTTAIIAWSTNVNAGTVLRYGTDPKHLDQTAGMPWGGLTHRVSLKDLKPGTTYYFQGESSNGQGTGTSAKTAPSSFQTKPAS
jgi:Purple acid Phosphatase, N-terminal domain